MTHAQENDSRTEWFREAKFGLFIHWGPYAVIGRHEQARSRLQIPQDKYDQYVRQFNPVLFDPDEWVSLAQQAGCRYIVITSKHHDGFSIRRSRVTDYDMRQTSYRGDPLKMLADACARKGMRLGFYYSIMDWRHPDYLPRRVWERNRPAEGADLNRYLDFMKEELKELLTEYGDVAFLWFDGEWEHTVEEMRSQEILDFIRELSPNTLVNDRLFKRKPGNPADFGTPEQYVPATGVLGLDGKPALWEACMTINEDSWGYNKYETVFKTERDLIRKLIEVISKGGNLLLNIGPMPDGRIQDGFQSRLKAIGRWLDTNGEGIYRTSASCFPRLPFWGRCSTRDNALYLHVFSMPAERTLRLPGLKNKASSASLLPEADSSLPLSHDGEDILIQLPDQLPDEIASVVKVQLDSPPEVVPYEIQPGGDGVIRLGVESGELETKFGQQAKLENVLDHVFITNWNRPQDVPTWTFTTPCAETYRVIVSYAVNGRETDGMGEMENPALASFMLRVDEQELQAKAFSTGRLWVFKPFPVGELRLDEGQHRLHVFLTPGPNGETINLEKVVLEPIHPRTSKRAHS